MPSTELVILNRSPRLLVFFMNLRLGAAQLGLSVCLLLATGISIKAAAHEQRSILQAAQAAALSEADQNPSLYYPTNIVSDKTFAGFNIADYNPYGSVTNVICSWNLAASEASRLSGYDAPRLLSLTHLAQLLVIDKAAGESEELQEAAAGFAAHFILAQILPQYLADYDSILGYQLQNVSLDSARQAASLGEALATSLLQIRTNDGTQRFVQVLLYPTGQGPAGAYELTPNQTYPRNMYKANATSWLIPVADIEQELNATALKANPVGTPDYDADLAFTREYGSNTSTRRDANDDRLARTWYDEAAGTGGISVHWNQIALASLPEDVTLADTARLFATLNCALWDGRIAYFTVKYRDLTWRPITAIRAGDQNNAAVPDWTPFWPTVPEPEFPSGHTTLSNTAATVLARWHGTDYVDFAIGGEGPLPNGAAPVPPHNYTSFSSVVTEVSLARQLEGVHFKRACDVGELIGAQVGEYAMDNFAQLLEKYDSLSSQLQAPLPSISQPIYNDELDSLPVVGDFGTASA